MNNTKDKEDTIKIKLLGEHLYNIISEASPQYFISLRYNLFENNTFLSLRKEDLYNVDAVRKTHKHLSNLLREAFSNDLRMFWFIERNAEYITDEGKTIRSSFHSHLILSTIQDYDVLESKSRLLKKIMKEGMIPIENRSYTDIEDMKVDCIDSVLRRAEWIGKGYDNAVDIRYINDLRGLLVEHPNPSKDYKTGYLLKQINHKTDIDICIDYKNSNY